MVKWIVIAAIALLAANHWFAPLLLIDPLDRFIYLERRVLPTNDARREYVMLVPAIFAPETPEAEVKARLAASGYTDINTTDGRGGRLYTKPAGGGFLCGYTYELWVYFYDDRKLATAAARVEGACF